MRPPVRTAVASQLRALADLLAPLAQPPPRRSPGALVRIGGRWWHRGELLTPAGAEEVAADVQLRP